MFLVRDCETIVLRFTELSEHNREQSYQPHAPPRQFHDDVQPSGLRRKAIYHPFSPCSPSPKVSLNNDNEI